MSFTPVSWLAERVSRVRVGGRQLRSQLPTENIPVPVLKAGFWLLVIVLFVDEFLILASIFGGPIALVILLGFALSVFFVRRTKRGARMKRKVTSSARSSIKTGRRIGYDTRRRQEK